MNNCNWKRVNYPAEIDKRKKSLKKLTQQLLQRYYMSSKIKNKHNKLKFQMIT